MSDRTQKNSTRHATNVSHTRLPLDNDYEVVQARTSSLRGTTGKAVDSPHDELRGKTTWSVGESWYPEDDPEFALDENSEWYEEELERDVGEVLDRIDMQEKAKKDRSEASVSTFSVHQDFYLRFCSTEEASGSLEIKSSPGIP